MPNPTAAFLVIGDEILSGRTREANIQVLATALTAAGIDLTEIRVIRDGLDPIVAAVNELRLQGFDGEPSFLDLARGSDADLDAAISGYQDAFTWWRRTMARKVSDHRLNQKPRKPLPCTYHG